MKVIFAGGTGLVGRIAVDLLLKENRCTSVLSIARRGINREAADGEKLSQTDFHTFLNQASTMRGDTVCIALGTTIKKAGSQSAFRSVDYDLVMSVARKAVELGCRRCVVITALGADARSAIFYSRVKGEVEAALANLGFEQLVVIRPSMLLGRKEDTRGAERLIEFVSPLISPIMVGMLRRYRPVQAEWVARTLVEEALSESYLPALHCIESEEIGPQ